MTNAYIEIMTLLEQHDNPIMTVHPDGSSFTVGYKPIIPRWGVAILRGLAELLEPNPPETNTPEGYIV